MNRHIGVIAAALMLSTTTAWADGVTKCEGPDFTPPKATNAHGAGEYPPLSLALHEQGTTTLEFVIDEEGKPTDAKVIDSSGSLRLDAAAQETATQVWRYTPGTKAGKPTRCTWRAHVVWDLKQRNMVLLPLATMKLFAAVIEAEADMYPDGAQERGETGDNVLSIQIPITGRPLINLVQNSGYEDLDLAARRVVEKKAETAQCQFDDRKATCTIMVVVAWRLPPPKK